MTSKTEKMLQALAATEPRTCDNDGAHNGCVYCGGWMLDAADPTDDSGVRMFAHDEDCPWVNLPRILGEIKMLRTALGIYADGDRWEAGGWYWRSMPYTKAFEPARHALGIKQEDDDDGWVTERCRDLMNDQYVNGLANTWLNQYVKTETT